MQVHHQDGDTLVEQWQDAVPKLESACPVSHWHLRVRFYQRKLALVKPDTERETQLEEKLDSAKVVDFFLELLSKVLADKTD